MLVYIACPYTKGDVAINVRNAIDAAEHLANLGHTPIVPVLNHLWHMIYPHDHGYWMRMDRELLPKCDAILRLPGESKGADEECELAKQHGIPVMSLMEWK
jgi:hypothetical protein